ncbi:Uncharacterised protein [Mycobacteroides abscessus subsp. abscessus]|nr:Uncharacterised protein [Mycobacteroides abscessus subsp. abscessus]
MSLSGSPSTRPLAIADARSSVGLARRDAVSAAKYWKKSRSTANSSSGDWPREYSSSSPPNISCVSVCMRS